MDRHERLHDRVLAWANAVPCDEDDAAKLARDYAPTLKWADEALCALVGRAHGVARRITTEVERLKEECKRKGLDAVTPEMALGRAGGRA